MAPGVCRSIMVGKVAGGYGVPEKCAELFPSVPILPTQLDKISPAAKVLSDITIVVLIHGDVLRVVSVRHWVAVHQLAELSRPGLRGVPFQTAEPSLAVSASSENKLAVRISSVDFAINQWPWPVLKGVISIHDTKDLIHFASYRKPRQFKVETLTLESQLAKARREGRRSGLVKADAEDFHDPIRYRTPIMRRQFVPSSPAL